MKIFYDHDVDALYLKLGEANPEGVIEIAEGINVDTAQDGHIIGIEILDASDKVDLQTILSYSLEFDKTMLLKKAA
jgi:uncharacterized protein YuzE